MADAEKLDNIKSKGFIGFITNNRKQIVYCSVTAAVIAIALISIVGIRGMLAAKEIEGLEALLSTFDNHNGEVGPAIQSDAIETLLVDLNTYAAKAKGYAAARAYSLAGSIYSGQQKFPQSETAYLEAAKKGEKTFLAGISWYNAAVAAEEQDKTDDAIAYFSECLKYDDFAEKARVQFALGRLYESKKDSGSALESYRVILDKWPTDTSWANLAQSRIIALEVGM